MAAEYGMSDAIGPVAVDLRTRSAYPPIAGVDSVDRVSEETAREVDHEVRRVTTEAHETAFRLLREHWTTLEVVMRLLLEHEVVEGEEVRRRLAAEVAPAAPALLPATLPSTSGHQAVA